MTEVSADAAASCGGEHLSNQPEIRKHTELRENAGVQIYTQLVMRAGNVKSEWVVHNTLPVRALKSGYCF